MKTIESVINSNKKVYVRMGSDEICKRFFSQAEKEGFLFGREKPSLLAALKKLKSMVLSAPRKEVEKRKEEVR